MYTQLSRQHFDNFLKRARLAYPATIAWEASLPPETLAEVHDYWFTQTRLRGITASQLMALYQQLTGGAVVELGRYRPDALFQYICRRCPADPMYLDWVAGGRHGICPTLIDGDAERADAARVSDLHSLRYPAEPPRPQPSVDQESTAEYWERKFADVPRATLDPDQMKEMDGPHREAVENALRVIGFDAERDV